MICVSVGESRRCIIRIYIFLMVEMFYSFESCFTLFDLPLYSFTSVGVNRSDIPTLVTLVRTYIPTLVTLVRTYIPTLVTLVRTYIVPLGKDGYSSIGDFG